MEVDQKNKRPADELETNVFSSPKKRNIALEGDFEELLSQYYQRLFPFKKFYNWLSYCEVDKEYFPKREFSFTIKKDGEETYLRYKSFSDEKELKDSIIKLNPHKIDIGAVYTVKPVDHKKVRPGAFSPVEKELVFDIDMTDYDEIRTCCSGANICEKCWKFMTLAVKILDSSLREDFGFNHILWVYSGRRGVHCWVGDKRARSLNNAARDAIVQYLSCVQGSQSQKKKVNLSPVLHPSLSRAFTVIEDYFEEIILEDQDILGSKESWSKVLELIPDKDVQGRLNERWEDEDKSSKERWEELTSLIEHTLQKYQRKALTTTVKEIMFQYTYPRLDINVSTQTNHLLKSPFCIHPSTGRVCVPIDPKSDTFRPTLVPTVGQLICEIDEYHKNNSNSNEKLSDYKKTSLKQYMDIFNQFLEPLEKVNRQTKKEDMERQLNF